MPNSEHIFIQPWLNREERWDALSVSGIGEPAACAKAIAALCQNTEAHTLAHGLLWFIPVKSPEEIETLAEWPSERTVIVLQEPVDAKADEAWLASFDALIKSDRSLALAVHAGRPLPPPAGPWKWLITKTTHARTTSPYTLMGLTARMSVVLTEIGNRADFDWAAANNIQLMSSEFLLQRNTQASSKPDMARVHLLKLLSLIAQDAETREIEEVFRQEPKLSYSLMRLVNSAALNLQGTITSFAQAISILGRRQLQRWIQLLVYADTTGGNGANPLLLQAALRGRLIELATNYMAPGNDTPAKPDEAFMVGIFSMLDILLRIPMDEILAQLPLAENVKNALASREGQLGHMLSAVEATERGQFDVAGRLLNEIGIGCEDYANVQLDAINWAHSVSQTG